jgi:quaternary ammonium compound-resistance protein SugE
MHDLAVSRAWLLLLVAGLFEAAWAVGLKYTNGFTRPFPSALVVLCIVASVMLLSMSMGQIPVGTAYAVWTGIGVIGATALGVALLGERLSPARTVFLMLLLVAIVGLRLTERSTGGAV